MYKQKENRSPNRDRVLECIFRNPGISRKDTSDLTGITSATITAVVTELLREGILTELGEMEEDRGTIGRSRIALNVQPDYRYVVGVEFNYASLSGTVYMGSILSPGRSHKRLPPQASAQCKVTGRSWCSR